MTDTCLKQHGRTLVERIRQKEAANLEKSEKKIEGSFSNNSAAAKISSKKKRKVYLSLRHIFWDKI